MATYATPADLREYAADSDVQLSEDEAQLERLLARAERDVDRQLGPWPFDPATALRFTAQLAAMPNAQRLALRRATRAQAEFRMAMGEDELVGADDGVAAVGPVSFSRFPIPRVGPKVAEELSGSGLVIWSGTVAA